ncbi:MAG: hypothetical protein KDG50_12520 [Chromatiales bacterium]|nr:hypothetical protein [Chromatiales bacterium]
MQQSTIPPVALVFGLLAGALLVPCAAANPVNDSVIVDSDRVFHRIYVIGAGTRSEISHWNDDLGELKAEIEKPGNQAAGSTSVTLNQPTIKKLSATIAAVAASARPGEQITFYYSGHGMGGKAKGVRNLATQTSDEPYNETIWLNDQDGDGEIGATGLEVLEDDYFATLWPGPPAGGGVTLIMDACYAGGFVGGGADLKQKANLRLIAPFSQCPTDGAFTTTLTEAVVSAVQTSREGGAKFVTAQAVLNQLNKDGWILGEPFDNDADIEMAVALGTNSKDGPAAPVADTPDDAKSETGSASTAAGLKALYAVRQSASLRFFQRLEAGAYGDPDSGAENYWSDRDAYLKQLQAICQTHGVSEHLLRTEFALDRTDSATIAFKAIRDLTVPGTGRLRRVDAGLDVSAWLEDHALDVPYRVSVGALIDATREPPPPKAHRPVVRESGPAPISGTGEHLLRISTFGGNTVVVKDAGGVLLKGKKLELRQNDKLIDTLETGEHGDVEIPEQLRQGKYKLSIDGHTHGTLDWTGDRIEIDRQQSMRVSPDTEVFIGIAAVRTWFDGTRRNVKNTIPQINATPGFANAAGGADTASNGVGIRVGVSHRVGDYRLTAVAFAEDAGTRRGKIDGDAAAGNRFELGVTSRTDITGFEVGASRGLRDGLPLTVGAGLGYATVRIKDKSTLTFIDPDGNRAPGGTMGETVRDGAWFGSLDIGYQHRIAGLKNGAVSLGAGYRRTLERVANAPMHSAYAELGVAAFFH